MKNYLILALICCSFFTAQSQTITGWTIYGDFISINKDTVSYSALVWEPIPNSPKAWKADSMKVIQVSTKPIVWDQNFEAFVVNCNLLNTASQKFLVYLDKPRRIAQKDARNRYIKPILAH
jgi:hypothetical protein